MQVQSETTTTTVTDTETFRGRVKWFNSTRGYGFITNLDREEDTFVHHTGIHPSRECWKTLTPGEYVEYSLDVSDNGKSQAANVTGIAGGPLLCETNARNNQERTEGDAPGDNSTGDDTWNTPNRGGNRRNNGRNGRNDRGNGHGRNYNRRSRDNRNTQTTETTPDTSSNVPVNAMNLP